MKDTQIQLDDFRESKGLLAFITYSLLACMLFVFYSPSALAFKQAMDHMPDSKSHADQLMIELGELKDTTNIALHLSSDEQNRAKALAIYQNKLAAQQANLTALAQQTKQDLQRAFEQATEAQNLAQMQLYKQVLAAYDLHWPEIAGYLTVMTAKSQISRAEVEQLYSKLDTIKFGQSHHQYDNEQMPFGPLPNVAYKPSADLQALQARLGITEQVKSMSVARSADDLSQYLELNVDTASTDRLVQLATNLNGDAASIYQYVYNNIEYIPAFGSIQGADYTDQTQRGNAFDQASLMIALLRLSGIPARYVYGSVEVSPEQVKNWVGGVDVIEAAQNLLGQGGVPNVIINNQQGEVVSFGLEHVWVEYHQDGQWQAVDPSFKQYKYSKGLDVNQLVDLDGQTIKNSMFNGANQDENEGWVQGLNRQAVEQVLHSATQKLNTAIEQQFPNGKVQDILGKKEIVQVTNSLPVVLPYKHTKASQALAQIPNSLRHKFKYELKSGTGLLAQTVIKLEAPMASLLGKQVALSFLPTTEQDKQKLEDFLPADLSDISQLPKSFPYGLANVSAHLSIEGQSSESGGVFAIGQELQSEVGFWSPRFGWDKSSSPLIAGEYHGIGIDSHGQSKALISKIKSQFMSLREKVEKGDTTNLTHHDLVGNFLQAGIHTYFVSTQAQNDIASVVDNMVTYRQPSYGTFSTNLAVSYLFGVPMRVEPLGFAMDVDQLANNTESKTNCWNTWIDFNKHIGGLASYLENRIPEILFAREGKTKQGVSSIAALNIAANAGQKIYTLQQSNRDSLSLINIDGAARAEISSAINNGKSVLLHEAPVVVGKWQGSGYIIYDNESGAGAYKISGGANGGFLSDDAAGTLTWLGFAAGAISTIAFSFLFYVAAIITMLLIVDMLLDYRAIDHRCAGLGGLIMLAVGVSIAGIFAAPLMGIILLYTGLLAGNAPLAVANSAACRN